MIVPRINQWTYDALNKKPDLASLVLIARVSDRLFEIHARGESFKSDYVRVLLRYARFPSSRLSLKRLLQQNAQTFELVMILKLIFGWILARRSMTRKDAEEALRQPVDVLTRLAILWWSGKQGRPISLRSAAIRALIRREYLNEKWIYTTKRVCPCGKSHLEQRRVLAECQPKLQADVRILRRLLRDCRIELPKTLSILDDGEIQIITQGDAAGHGSVIVSPANDSPQAQALSLDLAKKIAGWRDSLCFPETYPRSIDLR